MISQIYSKFYIFDSFWFSEGKHSAINQSPHNSQYQKIAKFLSQRTTLFAFHFCMLSFVINLKFNSRVRPVTVPHHTAQLRVKLATSLVTRFALHLFATYLFVCVCIYTYCCCNGIVISCHAKHFIIVSQLQTHALCDIDIAYMCLLKSEWMCKYKLKS